MKPQGLEELTQKYVQGNLSPDEGEELAAQLSQDGSKSARDHLRLALKMDVYLQEAAAEPETVASPRILTFERAVWALGGIAAAVTVGFTTWSLAPAPPGVATVHRSEGQAHSEPGQPLRSGDSLQQNDRITVTEGLVELVFEDSGVHAVASAPLAMTVHSSEWVFLHEGDLKLTVPPQGIGFVVETEEREITDLGTSFVVTAREERSRVLVLDGLVSIGQKGNAGQQFMVEGEVATFREHGDALLKNKVNKMPELPLADSSAVGQPHLNSRLFAFPSKELPSPLEPRDLLGERFLPLVRSKFTDSRSVEGLRSLPGPSLTCIAGAYGSFGGQSGLDSEAVMGSGWMSWQNGRIQAPEPGRYRFVGYADNSLLVAIDGAVVFEGGRHDSAFRASPVGERQNFPAWPCLNSRAGFAVGPWFEAGTDPVEMNLLLGEKRGQLTYAILLIEREGETYEETSWGQPKWPLFLTRTPGSAEREVLETLQGFLDGKLLGGFTLDENEIWRVLP